MTENTPTTLLPLYRFGQLAGFHPLHFMQVELPDLAPNKTCDSPLLQYQWQNADRLGRDDVALAIATAEDRLAEQLGYNVLPKWEYDPQVKFPRPNDPSLFNRYGFNLRYAWQSVKTRSKYILYGGFENKTLIQASSNIVYTDKDGDGYEETATIIVTLSVSITNPEEVAIYYPGTDASSSWEIRPIIVSINDTTHVATITCRREQLVKPELIEAFDAEAIEGGDNTAFLTTVDVYRHFNDVSKMANLMWEPSTCSCLTANCACTDANNSSADCNAGCNITVQTACVAVRNSQQGFVYLTPGTYDSSSNSYTSTVYSDYHAPDRCSIYYRAGWRDMTRRFPTLQMDPKWERAVVALTLSMLERPICNCPAFMAQYQYWSNDLGQSIAQEGTSTAYQIGKKLDNPFGTKRGDLFAWELVKKNMLQDAIVV